MSLTSSRVRAVNAVYEAGNFSAAARRLGITQPAVTQQVRTLELDYGLTLFDRRGNNLIPTALCRQLYDITSRIEASEAEALAVLRQHEALKGADLRVGLGNSMPGMALISAFQRVYPDVRFLVEMGSWASILDAVVDRRVDVGVLPEVPNDARFRREVCLTQGVVAIVHPDHLLANAKRLTCAELIKQRLVFRTKHSSTQRVVDRAFKVAGFKPEPASILDTRVGVFEAVANGLGVGFMWEYGSSRIDRIVKIRVLEMGAELPEHIFCLAGKKDKLVESFFQSKLMIKRGIWASAHPQ